MGMKGLATAEVTEFNLPGVTEVNPTAMPLHVSQAGVLVTRPGEGQLCKHIYVHVDRKSVV